MGFTNNPRNWIVGSLSEPVGYGLIISKWKMELRI